MKYSTAPHDPDILRGVSIDVSPREFVSFIGRSGAGKTTLLRIVAGLEHRFSGEVRIGDRIVGYPDARVQFVFQDGRLLPWKTVFENVAFATTDPSGKRTKECVNSWLRRVGMLSKGDRLPATLSGGEATRVSIARAFVTQPSVLLLDEPFQGLDIVTRFEIQQSLLAELELTRSTVLLVSHSIDDAVFLSDEVHVLGSHPSRVLKSFSIDVVRPRKRDNRDLSHIAGEIASFMVGAQELKSEPTELS